MTNADNRPADSSLSPLPLPCAPFASGALVSLLADVLLPL